MPDQKSEAAGLLGVQDQLELPSETLSQNILPLHCEPIVISIDNVVNVCV